MRHPLLKALGLLLVAAAIMMACPGCTAAAITMTAVQAYMAGFQLYPDGKFEGEMGVNSTYIAIDAKVDAKLRYYAPVVAGGAPELVWERTVNKDSGQRAYQVIFTNVEGQDFIQIVPTTWEAARTQLAHLSPPDTEAAPLVAEPQMEPVAIAPPES